MGAGSGGPAVSGVGVALAGAFALALASPAQALDLNGKDFVKDESGVSGAAEWAGFYIGGQSIGVWPNGGTSPAQSDSGLPPHEVIRNPIWHGGAGPASSIRAGYNWGEGQVVYGLEGDLNLGEQAERLVGVRGRIGLVSDSWLFYGTGGAAFFAPGRSGIPAPDDGDMNFNITEGQAGLVAGAGVEARLGPDLSVGVEGLYYGFDAGRSPEKSGGGDNLSDVTVIKGRLTLRLDDEPEPLK